LPTTEPGWAGSTGRRTQPQTHAGGKAQRRRASGNEGNPSSSKPPSRLRSIRRRLSPARRSPPGAASPWPVFRGEGRRGVERAETEGTAPNEGTEGIAQVAKAVFWPQPPEHCPACQVATALARRDACRAASKRR